VEIILSIFAFMFGSVFASFFGVIISRVPQGLSIVKPDSRCDKCGHVLAWYENIPVLSYLILGGKCKECHEKIPFASFLYEVIGGLSLTLVYLRFGNSIETIFAIVITLLLLLIAGYDYATQTILDIFWILLLIVCVGLSLYRIFVLKQNYLDIILGFAGGLLFFGLFKLLTYLILKKDGLGTGDVIIMSIAGLILGPIGLVFATLVGSLTGCLIELPRILINKESDKTLAFCPYLCFGIFVSFLYKDLLFKFVEGLVI